jgi:hypothetical protein
MYSYTPTPTLESDDSLRDRLLYVAKPDYEHEIRQAKGVTLDEIAWRFNLRRRAQ